jgi:hypothetical protein
LAVISLWPLEAGEALDLRWLALAALFLGLAPVRPAIPTRLDRMWILLGLLLARRDSPVIMAAMDHAVVTPAGSAARLTGKGLPKLHLDRSATSHWIEGRPTGPAPETM